MDYKWQNILKGKVLMDALVIDPAIQDVIGL